MTPIFVLHSPILQFGLLAVSVLQNKDTVVVFTTVTSFQFINHSLVVSFK